MPQYPMQAPPAYPVLAPQMGSFLPPLPMQTPVAPIPPLAPTPAAAALQPGSLFLTGGRTYIQTEATWTPPDPTRLAPLNDMDVLIKALDDDTLPVTCPTYIFEIANSYEKLKL